MIGRRLMGCSKGAGNRCYGRWNHGDGIGCSCCGSCGPSFGIRCDNLNIYDKLNFVLLACMLIMKHHTIFHFWLPFKDFTQRIAQVCGEKNSDSHFIIKKAFQLCNEMEVVLVCQ